MANLAQGSMPGALVRAYPVWPVSALTASTLVVYKLGLLDLLVREFVPALRYSSHRRHSFDHHSPAPRGRPEEGRADPTDIRSILQELITSSWQSLSAFLLWTLTSFTNLLNAVLTLLTALVGQISRLREQRQPTTATERTTDSMARRGAIVPVPAEHPKI